MNDVQLQRYKNAINSDFKNVREEFSSLLIKDLSSVLLDYFNFDGEIKLDVSKSSGNLLVNISFCATSLKYFNKLPK